MNVLFFQKHFVQKKKKNSATPMSLPAKVDAEVEMQMPKFPEGLSLSICTKFSTFSNV